MAKRCAALALALCLSHALLFGAGGLMAGQGKVRYVSTEWFDIIYGQDCAQSAAVLAQHADGIYASLRAELGLDDGTGSRAVKPFRMPVVITRATDQYNAYFTNYNYNHIVLFDTSPDADMAVFADSLLGTFRHELMHAVTINMRGPFWRGFDTVFGDLYNLGSVAVMPPLIKEGAAVSSEGADGDGRLHDGYYLHTMRQAALMGAFPSAGDVAGARDVYPGLNLSYAFGGPFVAWLKDTYGMQPYADFWYVAVNRLQDSFAAAFKKAYGLPLSDAWSQFSQSVAVPDIPAEPTESAGVAGIAAVPRLGGAVYSSLTQSARGIAFIDGNADCVRFCARAADGSLMPPKTLFGLRNVSGIRFSQDGSLLAVTVLCIDHAASHAECRLFDVDGGRWLRVPASHVVDAAVVQAGGRTTLAVVECEGRDFYLHFFAVAQDGLSVQETGRVALDGAVYCPCDAGGGRLAFLWNRGTRWSIALWSLDDGSCVLAELPQQGMKATSLYAHTDASGRAVLSFSWATEHTFPRWGQAVIDGGVAEFSMQGQDVSGGVYAPVPLATGGDQYAYLGYFFTGWRVLSLDAAQVQRDVAQVPLVAAGIACDGGSGPGGAGSADSAEMDVLSRSKPWREPYYHKGTLVPLVQIPVYTNATDAQSLILFPGLTWMTNNPWDSDAFRLSVGVNPGGGFLDTFCSTDFQVGVQAQFSGSQATSLFSYAVTPQVVFDKNGFLQAVVNASVSSGIALWGNTTFVVQDGMTAFMDTRGGSVANSLVAQLSGIHKAGPGTYEDVGVALLGVYDLSAEFSFAGGSGVTNRLYPAVVLRLPKLIPITCAYGFTYNLPFRAKLSVLPRDGVWLDAQAEAVLFCAEIQRGFLLFPVYFNRVTLTGGYEGALYSEGGALGYNDMIMVDVAASGALNTGMPANPSAVLTLGLELRFFPQAPAGKRFDMTYITTLRF